MKPSLHDYEKKILTAHGKDAKVIATKDIIMKKPLEVAPFGRLIGVEALEVGGGFARVRLPYRPELTNPAGKLHGGVIASLADMTMAVAIGSVLGGKPGSHSTVKLEIKFKAAVTDGEIIAEGRVTQQKKKLFWGETVITNGNGQVVATAAATFMITDPTLLKPR